MPYPPPMARRWLSLHVCVALLATASLTRAQEAPLTELPSPREAAAAEARSTHGPTERLIEVRLANRDEKRREGFWLLGWGLANVLGGSLIAIAKRDDEAWLSAGLMTAGFGAINAPLSLGLLDGSGARRRMILDGRAGTATTFEEVREAEVTSQLRSAQGFALNTGLDVFYIATGLLMFFLGRAEDPDRGWLKGGGLAMVAQGAFLFGFDVVAWRRSNQRSAAAAAVRP